MSASAVALPRLERFLLGRSHARGVFQDRTGAIRRRFKADLDGVFENGVLNLVEDFVFDDGEKDRRTWHIKPVGESGYEAHADDLIGMAQGAVGEGVLRWSYLFSLKVGERRYRVRFHESFLQLSDDTLVNQARITKFGFEVGRTTLFFRRGPAG